MAMPAEENSAGASPGSSTAVDDLVDLLRPFDPAKIAALSAASHALRTPLTSIVGFVELLADGAAGPITAEQDRILAAVARSTSQLLAMIDILSRDGRSDRTTPIGAG